MERAIAIKKLHQGQLSQEFRLNYPEEVSTQPEDLFKKRIFFFDYVKNHIFLFFPKQSQLVLWMCSQDPIDRPTSYQLLRHSFFRSQNLSPHDFKLLKQRIQKLEQSNEKKQRTIESQSKRIAQLEEQISKMKAHIHE